MKLGDYAFLYNAAAHFAANEKYPDGLVPAMMDNTVEGCAALCWSIAELTTQAELMRRHLGYEPRELLDPQRLCVELMPYQLAQGKKLVMDAVVKGISPPGSEDDEVDEVLQELQKKTISE